MALPGTGVVPAATSPLNAELASLTRRAFIPRIVVQIYYATPMLFVLLGAAQRAAGGLAQVTAPVQGTSMVQGAYVGYGGAFNQPQVIPGVQNAQFNLSYYAVPVPLVLGEAVLQSTEAVIPIIDARMNDVYAVTVQQMSQALFTGNVSGNPLLPNGLFDAFDSGTNYPNYGGITRTSAGNAFWASNLYTAAGAILTRSALSAKHIQVTQAAGGESPDFAVTSPNDYAGIVQNFISVENGYVTPNRQYDGEEAMIRSAFPNVNINGIPFFLDNACPKGTMYMVNSKYFAMYVSEDAQWDFSGFYSLIPLGLIQQVGVALTGYNVICTKPVSGAQITGITGQPF
jgi:hypothetical protein